ncbi:MAG: uncharacterized protein PWP34_2263 [Desulfuromonadales bacterium]|nr:uncharacterized protein [Desulfuromonadales bacterium]
MPVAIPNVPDAKTTMPDWENICQQCGECCFEKLPDKHGRLYTSNIPCRFLDVATRRCKVYHKRFDVGEGCIKLTPEVVREADWLPENCAYVQHMRREKQK